MTTTGPLLVLRLEKAAFDSGFDQELMRSAAWFGFASPHAPLKVWLASTGGSACGWRSRARTPCAGSPASERRPRAISPRGVRGVSTSKPSAGSIGCYGAHSSWRGPSRTSCCASSSRRPPR